MGVLLRFLFPLIGVLTVSAAFVYAVYRGISALQSHLGLDEEAKPHLTERPPLESAREIADRIRAALRRDHGAGGEVAADFETEVTDILEKRLPRAIENRHRLTEYLAHLDQLAIERDVRDFRTRLKACDDDDLREVLRKNLALAEERSTNVRRLGTLRDKTEAQIRQVILGLQNLEDKVLSLRIADGSVPGGVAGALDDVRGEVDLLEAEYRKMEIPYDGGA